MNEWPRAKLGDFCTKIGSGATPRGGSKVYMEEGPYVLIRSQNVYNDGFHKAGLAYINKEAAEKLSYVSVQSGDILLNITGDSVARVCLAPKLDKPARVNQHVAIIRVNTEEFDSRFVRYYLSDEKSQNFLLTIAGSGGTRNALTKSMIENLEIPKPDIELQTNLADKIAILDEKIEVNKQLNNTLESIAQTLFQSWFVDFDPVKAKLAARRHGRDPERAAMAAISGSLSIPPGKPKPETLEDQLPSPEALDAAIAALDELSDEQHESLARTASLFPDDFEESESGLMPKGWVTSEIGKKVDVYGGSTPSTKNKEFWGGDNAWATPKDLSKLAQKVLVSTEKSITDKGVAKISSGQLPAGTVLMSSRAPVGYLAISAIPISVNQGFIAMVCNKTLPRYYVLHWLEANMDQIKSLASGSTFAEISKKNFRPISCLVPNSDLLDVFESMVADCFEQIKQNVYQSETLSGFRDSLLPKLLSGEIRVPVEQKEAVSA